MDYISIDGQKIEISKETTANLKKELCKPTYSIGDRFKDENGNKSMIVMAYRGVGMACLASGCLCGGCHSVERTTAITTSELRQFMGDSTKKRYWDNAKEERC